MKSARMLDSRLVAALILLEIVLLGGGSWLFFLRASNHSREIQAHSLVVLAKSAASFIDPEEHMECFRLGQEDTPTYRKYQRLLRHFLEADPKIRFVYTMVPTGKKLWQFAIDAEPATSKDHSPIGSTYDVTGRPAYQQVLLGRPGAIKGFETDSFGTWMSCLAPIQDKTGKVVAVVGVDMSATTILAQERSLRDSAWIFLACALLCSILFSIWLVRIFELKKNREELQNQVEERTRQLAQMNEALRWREERYRNLISTLPDLMLVHKDGQILFANRAFFAASHYPEDEVLGRHLTEFFEEESRLILQEEDYFYNQSATMEHELGFLTKEGERRVMTLKSADIEYGDASAVLLVLIDITERKILETQLMQAQKLESIGQLAAGIAHEINTPIQYIGDNVTFLQSAFQDLVAPEGEADLDFLQTEIPLAIEQSLAGIAGVTKIVRAMKEFSHPSKGVKSRIDLNAAIETTLTVARNEWKYVADLETDFAPDLPPIPCLRDEFNQAILNIVINAAHAIADKGESGARGVITVSTKRLEETVEVKIKDTGTGIPEGIRTKVFDPFFTTKEVGKGTGQGLSIARAVIVEKHGGSIDFRSEEQGTTFVIRLPLEEPSDSPDS